MFRRPLLVCFMLLAFFVQSAVAADAVGRLRGHFKSALVIDVATGKVLFKERANEKSDPASLVKMMLVLLAMEGVQRSELHLDDKCTISAKAEAIGGHQVYLKKGEVFRFEELLRAVMIGSANDAAYAVAEHVAGSQEAAVKLMNARASQLGMRNTRFSNAHGLPPNRRKGQQANYSTAQDLALLVKELIKYPLVTKWASTATDSFRNGTFQLVNTNHRFLKQFEGADGFKTGYHSHGAGFCLVGTAVRDGRRLLAVILGAESSRARLQAANQLLSLGFAGKL